MQAGGGLVAEWQFSTISTRGGDECQLILFNAQTHCKIGLPLPPYMVTNGAFGGPELHMRGGRGCSFS